MPVKRDINIITSILLQKITLVSLGCRKVLIIKRKVDFILRWYEAKKGR